MTTRNTSVKRIELTPAVEEGPYYKAGSPERTNIVEPGTPGTGLVLKGRVMDKYGKAIPHAWLDFWHADGRGRYDNEGFNLRGHQYSDEKGNYYLETVRPLEYLMRSPHIHAKVRANDSAPVFTTQLYFPGEERNTTDHLYNRGTQVELKETGDGQVATFDFVVET